MTVGDNRLHRGNAGYEHEGDVYCVGGEPSAIQETFPDSSPSAPAGVPFAVTWDVSDWYTWKDTRTGHGHRFRFTDPAGTVFEFQYRSLLDRREYVFG